MTIRKVLYSFHWSEDASEFYVVKETKCYYFLKRDLEDDDKWILRVHKNNELLTLL